MSCCLYSNYGQAENRLKSRQKIHKMKKRIFIVLVLVTTIISAGTLHAQDNARSYQKTKIKSNIKNDRVSVVKVSAIEEGCSIVVGNEVISPEDATSGLPTSKRMHKPFVITKEFGVRSSNNELHEFTSPGVATSGKLSDQRIAGQPIGGIIVKGGRNPGGSQFNKIIVEDGQFTLPSDCPDGEYNLTLSWSWGTSNSASKKNCLKSFQLIMENGICKGINQAGIK